jgi:hypothetical protein
MNGRLNKGNIMDFHFDGAFEMIAQFWDWMEGKNMVLYDSIYELTKTYWSKT